MRWAILAITLFLQVDADWQAYLDRVKDHRIRIVSLHERALAQELANLQALDKRPYDDPPGKRDAIARAKALVAKRREELKRVESPDFHPVVPWESLSDIEKGSIGGLNMRHDGRSQVTVLRVVDKSNAIVNAEWGGDSLQLWISGVDTANMVTDKRVDLGGLFQAKGRKMVNGATMWEMSPFSPPKE